VRELRIKNEQLLFFLLSYCWIGY